jgi:putative lipoic acid-binding regulatory protein
MDYQPSIELLEATHRFPGPFMFKVVGRSEEQFVARVLAAVRSRLGEENEPAFSIRNTANGVHTCVTIEPEVPSAAAVVEIYAHLRGVEGVMMLF